MKKLVIIFAAISLVVPTLALASGSSSEDIAIPENMQSIYDTYLLLLNNKDIGDTVHINQTSKDGVFSFRVHYGGVSSYNDEKSFRIAFSQNTAAQHIKDCIIATILAFSPETTLDDAKSSMSDMVSSYTGNSRSTFLRMGDYTLYIEPGINLTYGEPPVTLRMIHTDDFSLSAVTSQYSEMGYAEANSPISDKSKIVFRGRVIEQYSALWMNSILIEYLVVQSGDEQYVAWYSFDKYPRIIRKDIDIDFYGTIRRDMRIDKRVLVSLQLMKIAE